MWASAAVSSDASVHNNSCATALQSGLRDLEFLWCPSTHMLHPDMTACETCEPHCNRPHQCIRSSHSH